MNCVNPSLQHQVNSLANQCVRCGLCLNACPTYQLKPSEAESPRGRIQLLAAVARGELTIDATLNQHLSQCLSCRQCEAVCPAKVPYESLLIKGRTLLQQNNPTPPRLNLIVKLLTRSTPWRRGLFAFYRSIAKLGLVQLSAYLGLLRALKLERTLRYLPRPLARPFVNKAPYRAATKRGAVVLLMGCSSDVLEPQTLHDATSLLTAWGFDVIIPRQQSCCGALHAHTGLSTAAEAFKQKNTAIFQACAQQQDISAFIQLTTGCASTWQQYANLAAPIIDIQRFLLDQWPPTLTLKPLALNIAVHSPCSQRNSMGEKSLSLDLLRKIPALQLSSFGDTSCCGAAGDYFLKHPAMSDQLGQQLITHLNPAELNAVASANLGCRLQLAKQWHDQGIHTLRYYHPISLLALAMPLDASC